MECQEINLNLSFRKFILVIYCLTMESVQSPKLEKDAAIIQLFHPVRKPIHPF